MRSSQLDTVKLVLGDELSFERHYESKISESVMREQVNE